MHAHATPQPKVTTCRWVTSHSESWFSRCVMLQLLSARAVHVRLFQCRFRDDGKQRRARAVTTHVADQCSGEPTTCTRTCMHGPRRAGPAASPGTHGQRHSRAMWHGVPQFAPASKALVMAFGPLDGPHDVDTYVPLPADRLPSGDKRERGGSTATMPSFSPGTRMNLGAGASGVLAPEAEFEENVGKGVRLPLHWQSKQREETEACRVAIRRPGTKRPSCFGICQVDCDNWILTWSSSI